jgi:hypothetical protein
MFAIEVLTGIKIALLLIVALASLGGAVFLVRRARGATTQALWMQILGVSGWSASLFAALTYHSVFGAQVAFVFPPLWAAGLLLISLAYPGEKWKPIYLLYLLPLILSAIGGAIPNFFVTNIKFNDGYLSGDRSVWNGIYSIVMLVYMVVPTVLLFRRAKREKRAQLSQRLYLLGLVSGISYGVALLTNALLPVLFKFPYLNATGPIWSVPVTFVAFWLLAQRYSINRRALAVFVAGRVAILIASVVVYALVLTVLLMTPINVFASSVAAAITTILTLTSFSRPILYVIERIASGDAYDHSPELAEGLSRASTVPMVEQMALTFLANEEDAPTSDIILTHDVNELISERVAEFISATQPGAGSFYLREHAESEEWGTAVMELADTIGAALIVPLVHDRRVVGILAVGEKRGGFTADDCVRYTRYGRIITAQLIRAALVAHTEREIASLEAKLMSQESQEN